MIRMARSNVRVRAQPTLPVSDILTIPGWVSDATEFRITARTKRWAFSSRIGNYVDDKELRASSGLLTLIDGNRRCSV